MIATSARLILASVAVFTLSLGAPGAQSAGSRPDAAAPARPALIVLVVVDQFRGDYVETFGHQWIDGLRELFQRGAVFTNALVPYAQTRTCAGHGSISTGTVPSVHGLVDNDWFDRETARFVTCTHDPSAAPTALGPGRAEETHGPRALRAPTLADELRRQSAEPPRVVSLALKARSAVTLIGHGGPRSIAAWEEDNGTWATSSVYARLPMPAVLEFVTAHPATAAEGAVWERRLPIEAYLFDDRAAGEPADGVFPHRLRASFGGSFVPVWDASPFSDAYLGDLAIALSRTPGLGQSAGTDLLLMSFAALDYVGHAYGPRSHEVQDVLARLDATLGRLMSALDRSIGRDRYVLALTSDHGVAPLPGDSGGRVSLSAVGRAVDAALSKPLGRRSSVRAISGTSLYLAPEVAASVRESRTLREDIERALRQVPGVARVYFAHELSATDATSDAWLAALRASYVPDRSGDVLFVPARGWVLSEHGTNHGTPYEYDTRVPLAFIGAGIEGGRYEAASQIIDVAPTLAALAGIRMPRAQGRVLTEALRTGR